MIVTEEGVKIKSYGDKISKKLNVFYNPKMKINRDISLLVIDSYFTEKKIVYCDPMAASGIRQLRFLKTIPNKFSKLVTGDISKTAISNIKKNFLLNFMFTRKLEFSHENAINTISKQFYDFIEIDPFGTPVPFLDVSCQRIKHNGILSVTATDTAALCGTYPKTCLRRYGIKVEKPLWHEEIGLRNLIAYCIIQGAKYEKKLTPIVSFTNEHFYKIFFKVEEGRRDAYDEVKKLSYISIDRKSQEIKVDKYESKNSLGKTYIGKLNDKKFLKSLNLNLIKDNREVGKLINKLIDELDCIGHFNTDKLQKEFKFSSNIRRETLFEELRKKKYKVSIPHNSRKGIKTNASSKVIVNIMKKY